MRKLLITSMIVASFGGVTAAHAEGEGNTISHYCTIDQAIDGGYWSKCTDGGGVFFTSEDRTYSPGENIRAVFDTSDPEQALLEIDPVVYTITSTEGNWFYAITGDGSDGESLDFSGDEVNGVMGGVGQHVRVMDDGGYRMIVPCDENGNY